MLSILKNYFSFLGDQKKYVQIGIGWSIIKTIGIGFQYMAVYIVLIDLINNNISTQTILTSVSLMLINIILMILSNNYGRMSEVKGTFRMCADKRNEIGDKMKYFPMGYFNSNSMGLIASTVTTTLDTLQNEGARVVSNLVYGILHGIFLTLFMTAFNYKIGLIAFLGILIFIGINSLMQKKSMQISPSRHKAQINLIDAVLEYFNGIAVVRSYNLALEANQKLKKIIDDCEYHNINLEIKFIPFMILQALCLKVSSLAIIITATILAINSEIELPMAILMIIASMDVFKEIELAGSLSALLRLVENAMIDVKKILRTPLMNNTNGIDKIDNSNISCKNVSFSYDHQKIIDDISVNIKQGSLTAIVGPSGGGKTTLCHLISRFWDVDNGKILLGKHNIKDYNIDTFLSNFSLVFQDVFLFNDTIANNIKFGKKDASMKQVIAASKKACCHDFIMALPNGYDTIIGEGGSSISGGEKQRISIARAIIKDAPIIILDEATSNVDPENEKSLQDAIFELTKNKTVIMIAHRLKTILKADQILVVDNGKIIEKGTHNKLMQNNKTYAKFVNMRNNSIGWKLGKNITV